MSEPTVLYVDNSGAVELSKDVKSCNRSRHVERRYFHVREQVAVALGVGEITVKYKETKENHASDALTKPLDGKIFAHHVQALMGKKLTLTQRVPDSAAAHLSILKRRT